MINQLSEYEMLRERNIEERTKLFGELNLGKLKTEAAAAAGILENKKYVASKRGLAAQRKEKEILPPRKSLRLQGIDAETGLQLPEKEPTQYFINGLSDDEQRLPLKELELDEIISSKD